MNVFQQLISRINRLNVDSIVKPSIDKETLDFVEELNKEQLQNSINVEGDSLGEYHQNTVNFYNNFRTTKVSLGEDVKLYDTGKLYESITAELTKEGIKVHAKYDQTVLDKLEDVYDKFIGLTDENKEYVANMMKPKVIDELKKKLLR